MSYEDMRSSMRIDIKQGRPQVILVGNGPIRACEGASWESLIHELTINHDLPASLSCPYIYKVILATKNDVRGRLRSIAKDKDRNITLYGKLLKDKPDQDDLLKAIIALPADSFLTTNYSYELEHAAIPSLNNSPREIMHLQKSLNESGSPDKKYLLHTYNEVEYESEKKVIWHIHGEARLPETIIISQEEYGRLLNLFISYASSVNTRYSDVVDVGTWLDYFILGDVFVIGLGMDFSEIDLWWLLEWKLKNKMGSVVYYEASDINYSERIELLKMLGCKIRDCGMRQHYGQQFPYKDFYDLCIKDIENTMKTNRSLIGGEV